jgi:phosphatidylglycerol:prolipoprotein diacylglycerol transferase
MGERLCKKRDLDVQIYWRMVFFALVFGLVGARVYHVIHRLDYFLVNPREAFMVWQGGLGIWGAIFGGLLGLFLSTGKINKAKPTGLTKSAISTRNDVLAYLDIFAVCAPLAQAIGRWGNFFNKELFGFPTNLPWGIYIPPQLRPDVFKYYDYFHPLFLYESLLALLLFGLFYRFYARQGTRGTVLPRGSFVLLYLLGYALIRFSLEFFRLDPWKVQNFPVASLISVSVILIVFVWLLIKQRKL